MEKKIKFKTQWLESLKTMTRKEYWNKPNTVEFFAFMTKIIIIFPGLLLGQQFWWLYIFALASSLSLIWSSTVKTLPTIIWFNILWTLLAILSIAKHFELILK
jgi:hypothetical protein